MRNVRTVVGRTVAHEILDDVRRRVANGTGWLKIYRDALQFWESTDGTNWMVLGYLEVPLNEFPAETSLATIGAGDEASLAMAAFNPWPIDMIPPVSGGYNASLTVRQASAREVENERNRIHSLYRTITGLIEDKLLTGDALLKINGKVEADISFLGKRLELGLGGLPRVPHWLPARLAVERKMRQISTARDTVKAVDDALRGGSPEAPRPARTTTSADVRGLVE